MNAGNNKEIEMQVLSTFGTILGGPVTAERLAHA
jgi:hypothetical protein